MSPVLSSCPPRKRRLAAFARASGATAAATAFERRRPALRVVNSHSVPTRYAGAYADQVRSISRSWTFAAPAELPGLLDSGVVSRTLLVCLDDGLANTITNAAPILEDAGARAIFAVPAAWPEVPASEQGNWFRRNVYPVPTELHEQPDDVAAPTWRDLRELVMRGHEVWSHGFDHLPLRDDTPDGVLRREIVDSKDMLEQRLGVQIRGYCPPVGYNVPPRGMALIAETYEMAFGGRPARVPVSGHRHAIPRSNIEASWPSAAVDFQLTPLGDALSRSLEKLRG